MTRTPPVYLLIEIQVTDAETYSDYVAAVASVVTGHGGRYLVRGGETRILSGAWEPERFVIIEFDSIGALQDCFTSPEYTALAPLRERSTVSRAVILHGVGPDALAT
jgi:uncharacterized protein (DUF1330 family)